MVVETATKFIKSIGRVGPKVNLLLAYSNFMSVFGLISGIVALIITLMINKPLSYIVYKYYEKLNIASDAFKNNVSDSKFINPYDDGDIDSNSDSTVSKLYGPDVLLKYNMLYFGVLALMFTTMGVIYLASEYQGMKVNKLLKKCNEKLLAANGVKN